MKVVLLRADNLRHKSLAAVLQNMRFLQAEVIEKKNLPPSGNLDKNLRRHFLAREQSEADFFSQFYIDSNNHPTLRINSSELNSDKVYDFLKEINFDIAITFGVSILQDRLIEALKDSIMGVHLGLSPYYRGSGTNFFPFVNNELSAVGYTLMHLNNKIDKGAILHQGRAPVVLGDSIHSIGNRNIRLMNQDIVTLLTAKCDLQNAVEYPEKQGKFYQRKDFNLKALEQAMINLKMGLVENYLENKLTLDSKFNIIQSELLVNVK